MGIIHGNSARSFVYIVACLSYFPEMKVMCRTTYGLEYVV